MLSYALKLIFILSILLGLAWLLNIRQIDMSEKVALQEENWRDALRLYHELRYPELWRVFYGRRK